MTSLDTLLLGQTLSFTANPFETAPSEAIAHIEDGAVAIRDGLVVEVGQAVDLKAKYQTAAITDFGTHLIMAGFVDAHVHYPQTSIIASWGKQLIDWLNTYTFPEEMRFRDPAVCADISNRYLDLVLAHGTTTVASYTTIHPESVTAFFTAAQERGMAVVAGKTCMDRNAPDGLLDTAQSAYDDSRKLLQTWHRKGRARYAITPRFSPTSSEEQLRVMGTLWAEHPDCLMQTHISEQLAELQWVADLFPDARDYLDTYEKAGLLGPGAVLGHAIYLNEREKDRIRDADAALVHCPTSNTFIGSGLFDTGGLASDGHRIGLATDTGGGSSFSMLHTMAAAYEIGQLKGRSLHPSQLLWLATIGSARALRMDAEIGNLVAGMAADLVILDLASTQAIAQRAARAEGLWDLVFPTIMMGDDRAIAATWVNGQLMTPQATF